MPETTSTSLDLAPIMQLDVGQTIGQCRAVPVNLGDGQPRAVLAIYGADFDVDPFHEMFFFPTDTLKMMLFTVDGEVLWRKDLGRGVVPGMWFCPIYPFDLDGDGVDEIHYVDNADPNHPLGLNNYMLQQLDAATGEPRQQWPWPRIPHGQAPSWMFRNFILGGYVGGEPVLVTAQGTYRDMALQGWNPGMQPRFHTKIPHTAPGALGSHMCPVIDLYSDGRDKVLWGERCIELDDGSQTFCCDEQVYSGHSDIIQPVLLDNGRWLIYTCRESDNQASPRVVTFDDQGQRVWGQVDHGHIDMGWVARVGENGRKLASAIRISDKTCGPDGRFHKDMDEFNFDVLTGEPVDLPYSTYHTLPIDLDGDGLHELVRGVAGGDGDVLDRRGQVIGNVGGNVCMASKFTDLPGEQLLVFNKQGQISIWADRAASDSPAAQARYANPYYSRTQRLTSSGSNLVALGGL